VRGSLIIVKMSPFLFKFLRPTARMCCVGSRFEYAFPENECATTLDCVAFFINFGLRAGGGIGDFILGGGNGMVDGPISDGFARLVRFFCCF
jgi:hypothetical protein